MKGADFIKIMRKVIREEVRQVVKEELKNIAPIIKESRQVPQNNNKTKANPKLNNQIAGLKGPMADILRETAMSMMNNPSAGMMNESNVGYDEWPSMNNDMPFQASDANGFGMMSSMQRGPMVSMDDDLSSPSLANDPTAIFMKDYSAVMKAADKVASGNR